MKTSSARMIDSLRLGEGIAFFHWRHARWGPIDMGFGKPAYFYCDPFSRIMIPHLWASRQRSPEKITVTVWNAETDRRMALQRAEFDAADKLAIQIRRVCLTAPVDDDYPEVRSGYECALRNYIDASKGVRRHPHLPRAFLTGRGLRSR
jgi:hypothetical protein